jgi:hypothetical protein
MSTYTFVVCAFSIIKKIRKKLLTFLKNSYIILTQYSEGEIMLQNVGELSGLYVYCSR